MLNHNEAPIQGVPDRKDTEPLISHHIKKTAKRQYREIVFIYCFCATVPSDDQHISMMRLMELILVWLIIPISLKLLYSPGLT